ncbi:MAG: response regulator [Gemmatimonadota bacterium]
MGDDNSGSGPDAPKAYILVVDDDEHIRALLRNALEPVGYEVETAADGDEAMRLLRIRCPDLLIADLIMPGVSGDELARQAFDCCPNARLVFVSGYPAHQLRSLGITQVVFLEKPIRIAELRAMVKEMVGW